MSYQVLALKYRPQTFDDVIGQAHVATTLVNALKSQKVAHAYLFAGPRGVGKTTTARILAKALNCAKGPTAVPCNACDSCLRIAEGRELVDVLEIDAASNRGIEEIRELRENVRYAPARSRYKVYIVDEAHQITHDAFNAFLKTLEEPPEHAVFVLATTEHQKIPATILSRCQLFRFKRVSPEEIAARINKILQSEKIEVEPAAAERIARAAGGSVRDALSLLDQALAFAGSKLTAKQIETLLGFLPDEFLDGFASALLERKPDGILTWVKQLVEEGWDLPQFVRDFREFLRQTIVDQLASGGGSPVLKLAGRSVRLAEVLHMIKVFGQCVDEMRWNDNPRLVLELYSLRLTQPFVDVGELLQRLEKLERGSAPASEPSLRAPGGPPRNDAGAGAPAAATSDLWPRFLKELWKKPTVASHVERARLKSAGVSEWTIGFADRFGMEAAQRSQALIEEVLSAVAGRPMKTRFAHDPSPDRREASSTVDVAREAESPASPTPEPPAAIQDERVQKVLEVFRGKIRE